MQILFKNDKQSLRPFSISQSLVVLAGIVTLITGIYACGSSVAPENAYGAMPPPQLPVISIATSSATTYREYPASLEGKINVEIRPQVEGYLEKIYVDERCLCKSRSAFI